LYQYKIILQKKGNVVSVCILINFSHFNNNHNVISALSAFIGSISDRNHDNNITIDPFLKITMLF